MPLLSRKITGHRGQGPDLASARVVWLSQSRLHPALSKKKGPPTTKEPPATPSSCPSRARPCRPPAAVQPVSPFQELPGLPGPCHPGTLSALAPVLQLWGRPHLAQARACLVSRLVDKDQRVWLVVDIAPVRPAAARSRSDPGHPHLIDDGKERERESQRARPSTSRRCPGEPEWSHLANERSISTSKGPPPAPAKARLDAMLLLGPCLFSLCLLRALTRSL